MERNAISYTIAGHTFDLRDQIANAARFVQWGKSFIDEAVKASPEASMAWCGICLVLPLLTSPSEAVQAHRDGLAYITGRMQFYVSLEPLLFPKRLDTNAEDLRQQFESSIVKLYQHILEYQLTSVLWFFRTRLGRFRRALTHQDTWSVSAIQDLESDIKEKFKVINDSSIRKELEIISSTSEGSAQTIRDLLSVANEQLLVSKELLKLEKYANFLIEPAALHDSSEHQNEYSSVCQEGTQKRILEDIKLWADTVDGETIYWLHGPAGFGKSTISRTVARDLASTKQLGASYFFKRQGRSTTKFFFPTIVNSLIQSIPQLETYVCESLDRELGTLAKAGIETKSLEVQFKTLVLDPVSNLPEQYSDTRPRVIVVDALDECEYNWEIERLCSLLISLSELHKVRLRVLVTSRDADPIVRTFKNLKMNRSLTDYSDETKNDIHAFLGLRLKGIKEKRKMPAEQPWPEPKDLEALISLATTPYPLFIYAVTFCRYVETDSINRMKKWLKNSGSNASQLDEQFKKLYMTVLEEAWAQRALDGEQKQQLHEMLHLIIVVFTPLPGTSIAALLGIEMETYDLHTLLSNLHAVLDIPSDMHKLVQPLHKSFRDFLLNKDQCGADFWIDETQAHARIAARCIEVMSGEKGLRENICKLEYAGMARSEVSSDTITACLPAELQYACCYWVGHLQQSRRRICDHDETDNFLRKHFLHLLEALGLLGRISESITMIATLQSRLSVSQEKEPPDVVSCLTIFRTTGARSVLFFSKTLGGFYWLVLEL